MSEWKPYKGAYQKRWYDIRLSNGEIKLGCWPNAGGFHVSNEARFIDGSRVKNFREADDPLIDLLATDSKPSTGTSNAPKRNLTESREG